MQIQSIYTLHDLFQETFSILENALVSDPKASAELILWRELDLKQCAEIYLNQTREIPSERKELVLKLARKRAQGIPLQYIFGSTEFFSLLFHVSPACLIPRPETELLVEAALNWMKTQESDGKSGLKVLDIATGSGNIAIALAKNFSRSRIIATDISQEALKIAQKNILEHKVSSQIELLQRDLLNGLVTRDKFDLVISNPPYIDERDLVNLPIEVREHEPWEALDGGPKGLKLITQLIQNVPQFLRPRGVFFLEFGGSKQTAEILTIAHKTKSFKEIEILKDYSLEDRMLKAVME